MVNRSGRFGAPRSAQQQTTQREVTAEEIAGEVPIPPRRFGESVRVGKARQQESLQVRAAKAEAIKEANRLEREFFSKGITIEQSEEAFQQVDPRVRQFISTTPTRRRAMAQQVIVSINQRIAKEQADINTIRRNPREGGILSLDQENTITRKEDLIRNLQNARADASTGAFTFKQVLQSAESGADIRASRIEARQPITQALQTGGLTTGQVREVVLTQRLTEVQAKTLSDESRQALGVPEPELQVKVTEVPAQRLEPVRVIDTDRGSIKVKGFGAFETDIDKVIAKAEKVSFENVASAREVPVGKIELQLDKIAKATARRETLIAREQKVPLKVEAAFLTGSFLKPFFRTAQFGKQAFTAPIQTAKATGVGVFTVGKKVVTGQTFPEVGVALRRSPSGFFAQAAGEVALFKGVNLAAKGVVKGVDIGRTVLDPRFRRISTRQIPDFPNLEEQVIKEVRGIGGTEEIVIIPARLEKRAATLRPSVRGGFGFTRAEQAAFIGEKGPIATAQANFKAFGITLEKTLFATPPLKETAFVRVSRLGESAKEATLLDVLGGEFAIKRTKPQVIIFPDEIVGRKGGFQPFGFKSSELEVVLDKAIIRKTGVPAVTLFKGKRIPIITAEIEGTASLLPKPIPLSKTPTPQISKAGKTSQVSSRLKTTPTLSIPRTTFAGITTTLPKGPTQTLTSIRTIGPTKTAFFPVIDTFRPRPTPRTRSAPTARSPGIVRTPTFRTTTTPTISTPVISTPIISPPVISPPIISPPIVPVKSPPVPTFKTPPFPTPPLFPPRAKPKRKKRKRGRGLGRVTSDVALSEGFTARILKFKPLKIPKAQLGKAIPKFQTIGIRRKPIVV